MFWRSPLARTFLRARDPVDWVDDLLSRVASLARFAKRGRVVPDIGKPAYRKIFQHPDSIIYRVNATQMILHQP